MPLSAGTQLGPYEILMPIGSGGMGEVYRARDPRMGRNVAIKVSAERFSDRFEREVRAVAALNHPNICQVYDVAPNYLVMELVEGATMAERIKGGALPLKEALAIARQIGDAIEATQKGIIHRDLKPANCPPPGPYADYHVGQNAGSGSKNHAGETRQRDPLEHPHHGRGDGAQREERAPHLAQTRP